MIELKKDEPGFGHMLLPFQLWRRTRNHICWSNKGYYVQTLLPSRSGPCKLQQTCFCDINNLCKGLCTLIGSLWEQPVLGTSEAGERVLVLCSVWSDGLVSAFYFISPVNDPPIFFLLSLSPHFLKLVLICCSNSYACFYINFIYRGLHAVPAD